MEKSESLLLSYLTLLLIIIPIAAATPEPKLRLQHELESATTVLRSAGYNLFPNAIATTDIRYLILSSPNTTATKFTFFAPPDSFLFALDFSSQADRYFHSLLHHVSPDRLISTDLLGIARHPNGLRAVPSLLPGRSLNISMASPIFLPSGSPPSLLAINGVRIAAPDLFVGSSITVHGLDRIILGDDPVSRFSVRSTDGYGISEYQLNQDGDRSFGSIQILVDNDQHDGKKLGDEERKEEGSKNSGNDRFFKFGSGLSG